MKWSDIPDSIKLSMTIIACVFGVVGYLTTFQTDAEAQAYQQQHAQELSRVRIQMIEQRIQEYRYQLLSSKLSPEQRAWIYKELERLEKQIECIRAGTC